jgi:hypothetical protein
VQEFVAINSPVGGRKRVLTPHQREKLQERRCDIPALYSDLSQQASQFSLDPTYVFADFFISCSYVYPGNLRSFNSNRVLFSFSFLMIIYLA